MAAEPLTLEEIIDEATDVNNSSNNEELAIRVANQVNREIGGPNTATKLLIQKIQMHQEVVTLQALVVIEACVKNCGAKFHNEIGKYKFINELIKLLSPKYDGDITPPSVKTRVIKLMFSWYCGLPHEKKIAEAYQMLKQQGIIKKDPVDPLKEIVPPPPQEATVFTDDGNQQLLQTLLASSDPDDLHQANKLIKSMVKQEEERLDRVSKRVEELETVSNNVKLLDDMLAKFEVGGGNENLEIMHDLYESCITLRPELFRLASHTMEDKDEGMAEILAASDELTRVIDLYKEKILLQKVDRNTQKPYAVNNDSSNAPSNQSALLDLGFDLPTQEQQPTQPPPQQFESTGNSLLDEQFKLLGLDGGDTSGAQMQTGNQLSQNVWQQPINLNNATQQPQPPQVLGMQSGMLASVRQPFFQAQPSPMQTSQQLIGAMRPVTTTGVSMQPTPSVNSMQKRNQPTPSNNPPPATNKRKNDLLDFDVFSEFRSPTLMTSSTTGGNQSSNTAGNDKVDGANQSSLNNIMDLQNEPYFDNDKPSFPNHTSLDQNFLGNNAKKNLTTVAPPPQSTVSKSSEGEMPAPIIYQQVTTAPIQQTTVTPLQQAPVNPQAVTPQPPAPTPVHSTPTMNTTAPSNLVEVSEVAPSPASAQVNYAVPLEALKPSEHPPISVYDKNGIKTFLNIVQDTRVTANPNVIVAVLSTISTSMSPINNFTIQVAVPKVMRVKLQAATSTDMAAFNPILPPPSISQVILIANPTKENVRLRFKIAYILNGVAVSESSSVEQFPVR